MPWLETAPVSEREHFIADSRLALYTMTELCARYNVSRKTGYKWIDRYRRQAEERYCRLDVVLAQMNDDATTNETEKGTAA